MALHGLLQGHAEWRDKEEVLSEIGARRTEYLADRVQELEHRVDRLALLSMALWEIIKEKTHWTDEDLLHRVKEIDLRDGVEDGRVNGHPVDCPQCHRPVSLRHKRCLYCGFDMRKPDGAFDSVVR